MKNDDKYKKLSEFTVEEWITLSLVCVLLAAALWFWFDIPHNSTTTWVIGR